MGRMGRELWEVGAVDCGPVSRLEEGSEDGTLSGKVSEVDLFKLKCVMRRK